eukprot:615031-Prymnesium_polylepis.1
MMLARRPVSLVGVYIVEAVHTVRERGWYRAGSSLFIRPKLAPDGHEPTALVELAANAPAAAGDQAIPQEVANRIAGGDGMELSFELGLNRRSACFMLVYPPEIAASFLLGLIVPIASAICIFYVPLCKP